MSDCLRLVFLAQKGVSEQSSAEAGVSSTDSSKPINDISHLIRRVKRSTEGADEISKKLKSADGSAVAIPGATDPECDNQEAPVA